MDEEMGYNAKNIHYYHDQFVGENYNYYLYK